MRHLSLTDRLLSELQHGLQTSHSRPSNGPRNYPARGVEDAELSDAEQRHVAGLMRVNNAGEVAAQGLYRGQAATARQAAVSDSMQQVTRSVVNFKSAKRSSITNTMRQLPLTRMAILS